MERRRWYKLGIKEKKAPKQMKDSKKVKSGNAEKETMADDSDADAEEDDAEEDETDDRVIISQTGEKLDSREALKKDLFGYIDENGTVVYINIEDDLDVAVEQDEEASSEIIRNNHEEEKSQVMEKMKELEITEIELPQDVTADMEVQADSPVLKEESTDIDMDLPRSSSLVPVPKTEEEKNSFFGRYFSEQRQPCPRINPCLMIRLVLFVSLRFLYRMLFLCFLEEMRCIFMEELRRSEMLKSH
jgi:hypothetical protein